MSEPLQANQLLVEVQRELPELRPSITSLQEGLGGPASSDRPRDFVFEMSFTEGLLGRLSEIPRDTAAIATYAGFLERMLQSDNSSVQDIAETGVIEELIGWTSPDRLASVRDALGPLARSVFDDLLERRG